MTNTFEVLANVKNVEFLDYLYCEEVEKNLPAFALKEETAEDWNRKARIQNTKLFIEIMKRQPKDYQEVLTWVYGFIPDKQPENPPVTYLKLA